MMRTLALGLIAAAGLWTQAPSSPAPAASDEAAVRALVGRYVNARDARDPAVVESLFTADADQYTTTGEWRRGRAQVVTGTAESSRQNPGARSIEVASVRFLTPDVAIADGEYRIVGNTVRRWTTIVAKREGGTWRISAIRNISPTGPTGPPAPDTRPAAGRP
jgi:uncharacterized protein (TIGR02246 family)